ncbi:hypothetical protein HYH70_17850 [Clostridium botulinum]|uniref:hypothetical protein n=1 Tax=Clostridium botulinum TaxID=1491 RepID=UPI00035BA2FF|nr:hypothetical protein [Clostridium botulinum]EPS49017.1 hypothetical protein CFSAN002367_18058 [Clostridium botulinum CFSAN002367]APR02639.1 hypothetical protein RSJ2_3872 [Clostridium botulinum]AUN19740.1 hypothetical protein B2M06_19490 [Clostridium botulinum]EPS54325.1 hypothetical protein CLQ_13598 [Clostridium botulinum Af84]KON09708.1 hypothetical protein ACP52_08515 [Clostridium botulinum]
MKWCIGVGIYKMKSGNYFILDIPAEMKDVGYEEECYEEDSNLLEEGEIRKLDNEEYGYYSLVLKPVNDSLSYNEVLEKAKQGKWHLFSIKDFVKRI